MSAIPIIVKYNEARALLEWTSTERDAKHLQPLFQPFSDLWPLVRNIDAAPSVDNEQSVDRYGHHNMNRLTAFFVSVHC